MSPIAGRYAKTLMGALLILALARVAVQCFEQGEEGTPSATGQLLFRQVRSPDHVANAGGGGAIYKVLDDGRIISSAGGGGAFFMRLQDGTVMSISSFEAAKYL